MSSNNFSYWIKQPNRITYARYKFSEIQENILTLIMAELQPYLTDNKKQFSRDLLNNPFVTIDLTQLSDKRNNYTYIKKQAYKMKFMEVNYSWFDANIQHLKERSAIILTTMDYVPRQKLLNIYLNPHVLPYLVYIGQCSKGKYTQYNSQTAVTIRGYLAKRIYKFLSSWKIKGATRIPVKEFKQILFIENKYKQKSELNRLLKSNQTKINKNSDIFFEFSIEKSRKPLNSRYITFLIFPKTPHPYSTKIQLEKYNDFAAVFKLLSVWFPDTKSEFAMLVSGKIIDNKKIKLAKKRLENMYIQYKKKEKSMYDCRNNIKTNCLKDWGITLTEIGL